MCRLRANLNLLVWGSIVRVVLCLPLGRCWGILIACLRYGLLFLLHYRREVVHRRW